MGITFMQQITSGERNLLVGIIVVAIVVVMINIVILFNTKDLIGLIALLLLLVLLLLYNISFINLYVDGDRIVLRKLNRDIEYDRIIRVKRLPVFVRKGGSLRTIFSIKYMDPNGRNKTKFIEIASKKFLEFPDLLHRLNTK
jgi:c-di-AMP phosphodiesterase-like protein